MGMRTLVDLPDEHLEGLSQLGRRRGVSRAKIIREAVRDYLEQHTGASDDEAYGLWGAGEDGLEYQQRLRSEW